MNAPTIVAPATAPQSSAVAIVRLSGKDALSIAQKITNKRLIQPRKITRCEVFSDQTVIDDALVTYFQSPHSYTGEDVIEFSLHGSMAIVQEVLSLSMHYGATFAKPGEFTERAFLSGKIDLAQAESVADLIASQSTGAASAAVQTLKGALSTEVTKIRDAITELRVQIEAHIDFSDEDISPQSHDSIYNEMNQVRLSLDQLFKQCQQGVILSQGVTAALVGPPNAGKSSLLHHLAEEEVAIVSDIPGTTRDVVRQSVTIDGVTIKFCDTAGLRDTFDQIELLGIQRTQTTAEMAQLIIFCIDVSQESTQSIKKYQKWLKSFSLESPIIWVLNKTDLVEQTVVETWDKSLKGHCVQDISVHNNHNIDALRRLMLHQIGYHEATLSVYSARQRHLELIGQAIHWLKTEDGCQWDIYAEHCRLSHEALGKIIGAVTVDDLLSEIFSTFCVGK